jgi:tetratricopeptide (TPR) repeat protein
MYEGAVFSLFRGAPGAKRNRCCSTALFFCPVSKLSTIADYPLERQLSTLIKMTSKSLNCTAEAHKLLGNEAFRAGRYDEAWKHYSNAIEADPGVAQYYTNRADALWK